MPTPEDNAITYAELVKQTTEAADLLIASMHAAVKVPAATARIERALDAIMRTLDELNVDQVEILVLVQAVLEVAALGKIRPHFLAFTLHRHLLHVANGLCAHCTSSRMFAHAAHFRPKPVTE